MENYEDAREKRKQMHEIGKHVKVGQVFLSRFEKSRIIGARALQISFGAPVLVEIPSEKIDPLKLADMELEQRVLPITIHRKLPDGSFQDIPVVWLMYS